jgi:VanZ family protein
VTDMDEQPYSYTPRRPAGPSLGERIARRGWLVWGAVILVGAVLPVAEILGLDGSNRLSLIASSVHFVEFALFALFVAVAWRLEVPASSGVIPAAIAGLLYGLVIELIQGPIPYRDFGIFDLAFDVAGVAVGLGIAWLTRPRRISRAWSGL